MARGLVRMERESGFCIWEQRGGKKKKKTTLSGTKQRELLQPASHQL